MRLGGSAPPGAIVRVYVDNTPIGEARADSTGSWSLAEAAVPAGMHRLRVDQLGAAGKVAARVEMPFSRESGAMTPGSVVVQPGLYALAARPAGVWRRHALHRDIPGQPRDHPRPQPHLSGPGAYDPETRAINPLACRFSAECP